MTIEEELHLALRGYCVELGWTEFDEETKKNGEITADSVLVDWKVFDYDQDTAIEYLKESFPRVSESIIRKVVSNNIKHTNYMMLKDIVKSPNPAMA